MQCDHSLERFCTVLSFGAVCFVAQRGLQVLVYLMKSCSVRTII